MILLMEEEINYNTSDGLWQGLQILGLSGVSGVDTTHLPGRTLGWWKKTH